MADHNLQAEYFDKPIWHILGKRMPWLVGLLILQSFSAAILVGSAPQSSLRNLPM